MPGYSLQGLNNFRLDHESGRNTLLREERASLQTQLSELISQVAQTNVFMESANSLGLAAEHSTDVDIHVLDNRVSIYNKTTGHTHEISGATARSATDRDIREFNDLTRRIVDIGEKTWAEHSTEPSEAAPLPASHPQPRARLRPAATPRADDRRPLGSGENTASASGAIAAAAAAGAIGAGIAALSHTFQGNRGTERQPAGNTSSREQALLPQGSFAFADSIQEGHSLRAPAPVILLPPSEGLHREMPAGYLPSPTSASTGPIARPHRHEAGAPAIPQDALVIRPAHRPETCDVSRAAQETRMTVDLLDEHGDVRERVYPRFTPHVDPILGMCPQRHIAHAALPAPEAGIAATEEAHHDRAFDFAAGAMHGAEHIEVDPSGPQIVDRARMTDIVFDQNWERIAPQLIQDRGIAPEGGPRVTEPLDAATRAQAIAFLERMYEEQTGRQLHLEVIETAGTLAAPVRSLSGGAQTDLPPAGIPAQRAELRPPVDVEAAPLPLDPEGRIPRHILTGRADVPPMMRDLPPLEMTAPPARRLPSLPIVAPSTAESSISNATTVATVRARRALRSLEGTAPAPARVVAEIARRVAANISESASPRRAPEDTRMRVEFLDARHQVTRIAYPEFIERGVEALPMATYPQLGGSDSQGLMRRAPEPNPHGLTAMLQLLPALYCIARGCLSSQWQHRLDPIASGMMGGRHGLQPLEGLPQLDGYQFMTELTPLQVADWTPGDFDDGIDYGFLLEAPEVDRAAEIARAEVNEARRARDTEQRERGRALRQEMRAQNRAEHARKGNFSGTGRKGGRR